MQNQTDSYTIPYSSRQYFYYTQSFLPTSKHTLTTLNRNDSLGKIHLEKYKPKRHHLDDTQIKNSLYYFQQSNRDSEIVINEGSRIMYKLNERQIRAQQIQRDECMDANQEPPSDKSTLKKSVEVPMQNKQIKNSIRLQISQKTDQIKKKAAIVQCGRSKLRIKDPFMYQTGEDTDSQFSEFDDE